ncbi:hypothetical protein D3C71_1000990 [compost metagenome]
MRGDVASAAFARVAAQVVPSLQQPAADARQAALHAIEQVAVAHQQLYQRHQVAAAPIAADVGLARTHTALRRHRTVERRVIHPQGDAQLGRRLAQQHVAGSVAQVQATAAQGGQLGQQAITQEAFQRRGHRQRNRAGHVVHGRFPASEG